nr:hypothetical protein RKHAN_04085 [Rhizobium sp. Khangiran2]
MARSWQKAVNSRSGIILSPCPARLAISAFYIRFMKVIGSLMDDTRIGCGLSAGC